ncbi:hypothetical protein NDU88_004560 [Pleurodeles waltl]|uniref:Uncharacterized protein n=1 Tax=Pleurodeles waltl TaxID=8319 RepID=A0AAV7LKC1_PLEWA|nr:hypothetical protein NDU88_004560 [Pleurodeles waltl]
MPLCPPASRTRDRAASAGVRRGGEGRGTLSSAHAVRVLGAPVAAQLTGELWTGQSCDPEDGGAPGALGGLPVRVASCVRLRSASAHRRWLRAADLGPGTGNASRFSPHTPWLLLSLRHSSDKLSRCSTFIAGTGFLHMQPIPCSRAFLYN